MEIRTRSEDGIVVVEPAGRLDTAGCREFEKFVVEKLDGGERKFVIDMINLEYVSSGGLRILLMLAKKLRGLGGKLRLTSMTPAVLEVFEIAGFVDLFEFSATQSTAIREIREQG